MRKLFIACSTLAVTLPSYATVDLTDQLSLSGFVSTSITKSSNKTELMINRRISDDTCFDCDTTAGLQLDYFNDAFKASFQLVKRPQDDWNSPEVEWGYVGYTIENIELRAGRLRLPLFLASEYYYVGHAYTYARPPDEVYNSILGITAYNGLSAVWNMEVFDIYQLSITPFIGFDDSSKLDIAKTVEADIDVDKLSGVNFLLSADSYRLNLTYVNADFDQTIKLTNASTGLPIIEIDYLDENVELISLGLEYDFDSLMLATEAQFNSIRSSWYTNLTYRMNALSPYITYGENHVKKTVATDFEGKTGSSFLIGVRYDIKYNVSMNIEWQQFKSFGGERGPFVEVPVDNDANLYSLVLNFVF